MASLSAQRNLILATLAFAVSFSLWGLLSGLAPIFKTQYGLTATQTSLLIAIPVLLGAIGRLVMGVLTDRFGGRLMFSLLLVVGAIPTFALALDHSYSALLFWGFWLGVEGAAFSIGVGFVSRWFAAEKQGTALGIYGAGNFGQSVAVMGAPLLAGAIGVAATFPVFGLASLAYGVVFALWARDAPRRGAPSTFRANLRVLRQEPVAWVLSLFYFLTFGGFVALGIALPSLLRDQFGLAIEDAGARTAGFVVLATVCRPTGGWIADRISGERLLRFVFVGLALAAWFLAFPSIYTFTIGALGGAALLGLGNAGVFKLVPQHFPKQAGTVAGLVGAAGGLGGFFPPIVLGVFRDLSGTYTPGFLLLSGFAIGCAILITRLAAFRTPAPRDAGATFPGSRNPAGRGVEPAYPAALDPPE